MKSVLEARSTLTDRYQTTVPEPVRTALGLKKRDAIRYELLADGEVRLSRAADRGEDPTVSAFLSLLEKDIGQAGRVNRVSEELVSGIQKLVDGVEIDLEAPLSPDDE
ncbi:MAG: regulator [Gammaproteobacteria bacterium]|nr:regulator [Gammaproteobacteria bacterium]